MAGARSHKSSTIFKRVQGLIKADAMQWKDRPLWYDVMEKFPPAVPPAFGRPVPENTVRKILYPEDLVRAKYYEMYGGSNVHNLKVYKAGSKTKIQEFINEYLKLQRPGATVDEICNEVEEKLQAEGKKLYKVQPKTYVEPSPLLHEDPVEEVKS